MKLTNDYYFFIEWMILEKKMDDNKFKKLTEYEIYELRLEYELWLKRQKV